MLMRATWERDDRRTLIAVMLLACAARVPLLVAAPLWSNDAYRYVWDGDLANHGVDPRPIAPDDGSLVERRNSPLWEHVDLRDIATVYPPVAIALFRLEAAIDPVGVRGAKIVALAGDALTIVVLLAALRRLRLPRGRIAVYALHPLVLVSFAQDAHIEAFAVAGTCTAIAAPKCLRIAGFALAILAKLYPLIFVPATFARDRRGATLLAAVVLAAYAPALISGHALGSLHAYVATQRFNETLVYAFGAPIAGLILALGVVLAVGAVRSGVSLAPTLLFLTALYLLTTPNALPWYLTIVPALGVLIFRPFSSSWSSAVAGLVAWSFTVALAYGAPWWVTGGSPVDLAVRAVEYAPVVVGALLCFRRPFAPEA